MTSGIELKEKVLNTPGLFKRLPRIQKRELYTLISSEEKQFLIDYNAGKVDINNNPIPPKPKVKKIKDFKKLRPLLIAFLITGLLFFGIYCIIVFNLPDFSASSATAQVYLIRIATALGLSLILGGPLTLLIIFSKNLGRETQAFLWITVILYMGLVPLFTWLMSGLDWAAVTLGSFAGSCGVSIPLAFCAYGIVKIAEAF